MGSFYVNYTVRGSSQEAVATALVGRVAIVTALQNGCVVVFDEESENQDLSVIDGLAARLSGGLQCPVLAVLNHDDDILLYRLYVRGNLADDYDSTPGYFDPNAEPSEPSGGKAETLCEAFPSADALLVEQVLRKSTFSDDGYVFQTERHGDLVSALGTSSFAVGFGYTYVAAGELPDGLTHTDLTTVA